MDELNKPEAQIASKGPTVRQLTLRYCAQVAQSRPFGHFYGLIPHPVWLLSSSDAHSLAGCREVRVRAQARACYYPLRRLLRRRDLRRCDARAANTLKYPTRRHRVSTAPAPPRDLYRAWHLPPLTHRPCMRFPLLSPHFSPSLPCFWQAQRRSDGRFGVVPKGAPASPPKSRPRCSASAPRAAHGGGMRAPVPGHAAAALAAAHAAFTPAWLPSARRHVLHESLEPRRTRSTTPAAPTIPRVPRNGGSCTTHPRPPSPTPHIHPPAHLHPHNHLLPTLGRGPIVTHPLLPAHVLPPLY